MNDDERERLIQKKMEEIRRAIASPPPLIPGEDDDVLPGVMGICVRDGGPITLEAVQRLQEESFLEMLNEKRRPDQPPLSPDQTEEVKRKIRKLRAKLDETGEIPPEEPLSF